LAGSKAGTAKRDSFVNARLTEAALFSGGFREVIFALESLEIELMTIFSKIRSKKVHIFLTSGGVWPKNS
jgi:hypothetical protein